MNLILVSHLIYRPIETFLERKLHFCTSGCISVHLVALLFPINHSLMLYTLIARIWCMSGRVAKPIKHIRFNDWLYLMCVDIDIDSIITRFAIDTHERTANSIDINLWLTYNKTHRNDRKKSQTLSVNSIKGEKTAKRIQNDSQWTNVHALITWYAAIIYWPLKIGRGRK